ncbi:MAG: Re/Si-specific NAD(P)(+) transhydrogenase subunit alpha [candidate division Zixibacteria bacterium]|nr:Re/Si-specific NAD(P)(+) transhydrogenase subunit alpha [candidate division Zixibacteria bacterium]MDH3938614.1 Re/Si-specific NAD(P)(+) transhydrogenase subunit alpha [candidate division Zixibacteria bacterium]MDH4035170.1 Re/Si-specific NAD(P)(+) transhydrogenase subunit alpha [candidate division Zixibacteria bacterium]
MTDDAKPLVLGIPKETFPGERRVAVVADMVPLFGKAGMTIVVESGAGLLSGLSDDDYSAKGAEIAPDRKSVFDKSDVILQVRGFGANPDFGKTDLELLRKDQTLVALFEPLTAKDEVTAVAQRGVLAFAMELIPRITRAQSMDVLSSMATVAGYKAVLLSAQLLPKMFPMLMTAAGTVSPAHVFVIGAGVAGLQAIATAKRLGAVVSAYDLRPAVREQVESLGASFVEIDVEAADSEDKGGYAKAMDEEFYRKQRELLTKVVSENDVVITTAAIPGRKAPVLITADMVRQMRRGSVIVDLAAERGGNCELTRLDETVVENGITILGPNNLPSTIPFHASQMYSRNLLALMKHLIEDGKVRRDMEDEIIRDTLMTHDGKVVNARLREAFGMDTTTERSEG